MYKIETSSQGTASWHQAMNTWKIAAVTGVLRNISIGALTQYQLSYKGFERCWDCGMVYKRLSRCFDKELVHRGLERCWNWGLVHQCLD